MNAVIDIVRACETEGWMRGSELLWLAEQAAEHRRIVEIGSYLGRSTRALADHTPGWVLAVDDWIGPRDTVLSDEERKTLLARFKVNVADLIAVGKVYLWHVNHREIPELLNRCEPLPPAVPPQALDSPDMVFVDGGHTYQDVVDDIRTWWPRLAPGGLLCGHDYNWDGVKQAVSELVGQPQVTPKKTGYIWYTTQSYESR